MPNWIGDLVMATPLLEDLRKAFPYAHITALCSESLKGLLENNPHLDTILTFKKEKNQFKKFFNHNLVRVLRAEKYDLGVVLPNSLSSAFWFFRAGVENIVGFSYPYRRFFFTHAVDVPSNIENEHLVSVYKALLARICIPPSHSVPQLYVSKEERASARDFIMSYGGNAEAKWIGINPGAAYGSAKCWLPERFEAVAQQLIQQDPECQILFFGDEKSREMINGICRALPPQVINLAGKTTLRQMVALIAECSGFLTNDSGPMHVAAALKVPLLALFGSTSDVKTGPYQWGKVIHKRVSCAPCYKRVCPLDFRCMKQIEVDEVITQLMDSMQTRGI
ncbi:MAG: lipopolysaccharide heptosyltransferase II [Simkaniaceae bacterium]|nr:lipopolysaccharide heptosyltransferase II [Simkaniaceae bacterium]MCF7853135.1 lipopolysaccharide heptosyltransferase II [Simkaniaceae bacterium]